MYNFSKKITVGLLTLTLLNNTGLCGMEGAANAAAAPADAPAPRVEQSQPISAPTRVAGVLTGTVLTGLGAGLVYKAGSDCERIGLPCAVIIALMGIALTDRGLGMISSWGIRR